MTAHYEKIMELWKAGSFYNAFIHFGQSISEGLLSQEEFPKFWELIEAECQENIGVMFNLYRRLKKARNWDDGTLCGELRIRGEALVH